jgi:type VII secretion integral membrane protein EccD
VTDRNFQVTVVGTRNQADITIPAQAPIAEYIHSLSAAVGEREHDALPAAWSLQPTGRPPLPPYESLEAAGVTDGELLYLCDLTDGEYDEPTVLEIDELVAATVERVGGPRWSAGTAAAVTVTASAAWLVAATVSWLVGDSGHGTWPGLLALAAGVALVAAAWAGRAERLGLTRVTRLILAMSAVPCLGVTGWCVGLGWPGSHPATALAPAIAGMAAGVVAGAMAALAVVPGIETTALAGLVVVACGATWLFVACGATYPEVTAVVAVAGCGLVVTAPGLAARLSGLWERVTGEEDPERALGWALGLRLAGTCTGSAVAALALALASAARNPFGLGLVAVLSCALLLRVGSSELLAEAVPVTLAGLTGLFWLTMRAPGYWGLGGLAPAFAGAGFGLAVIVAGLVLTFRHSARTASAPGQRGKVVRVAQMLCSIAVIPLVIGAFGVYAGLVSRGM